MRSGDTVYTAIAWFLATRGGRKERLVLGTRANIASTKSWRCESPGTRQQRVLTTTLDLSATVITSISFLPCSAQNQTSSNESPHPQCRSYQMVWVWGLGSPLSHWRLGYATCTKTGPSLWAESSSSLGSLHLGLGARLEWALNKTRPATHFRWKADYQSLNDSIHDRATLIHLQTAGSHAETTLYGKD